MKDPFEIAFYDYLNGIHSAKVVVHINKEEADDIPISYFCAGATQSSSY